MICRAFEEPNRDVESRIIITPITKNNDDKMINKQNALIVFGCLTLTLVLTKCSGQAITFGESLAGLTLTDGRLFCPFQPDFFSGQVVIVQSTM